MYMFFPEYVFLVYKGHLYLCLGVYSGATERALQSLEFQTYHISSFLRVPKKSPIPIELPFARPIILIL